MGLDFTSLYCKETICLWVFAYWQLEYWIHTYLKTNEIKSFKMTRKTRCWKKYGNYVIDKLVLIVIKYLVPNEFLQNSAASDLVIRNESPM
jgi:hypothetical protein